MPTILFPTDFSETATHAFVYVLHLADKLRANVITLHVYQRPEIRGAAHRPASLERFQEEADIHEFEEYREHVKQLDQLVKTHNFSQLDIEHTMVEGEPKTVIVKQAKIESADLIVMGTTGARGLQEIFVGSVTGEVLEHAPCPVLAVPAKSTFDGQIDHIALSISYQEDESKALDQLLSIADAFQATIHCIHVDLSHTETHNQRMEAFQKRYADRENIQFHVLAGDDLREAISDFVKENNIDFLGMVSHKRGFLQELFHYSHVKNMSYHSEVPVMSFPF